MLPVLLFAVALVGVASDDELAPPGDALALTPAPHRLASGWVPDPAGAVPLLLPPALPAAGRALGPEAVGVAATVAALAAAGETTRRSRRRASTENGPLVVFVTGHNGTIGTHGTFAPLIDRLGVPAEQIRFFDYRAAYPVDDHREATRRSDLDVVVPVLEAYLEELSAEGRPIYLVGFSLGGAAVAELVARWDRRLGPHGTGVVGAALLDPPMASGLLGALQSGPTIFGLRPHDGGYRPFAAAWEGPREDRRAHLGRNSSVAVTVFRNPKAGVTNFMAEPDGLRVFDVPDPGLPALLPPVPLLPFGWLWVIRRAFSGHTAVLADRRVVRCIRRELRRPGSCRR